MYNEGPNKGGIRYTRLFLIRRQQALATSFLLELPIRDSFEIMRLMEIKIIVWRRMGVFNIDWRATFSII